MPNLTKIINIFIDGVDKSNNKIYNVKCIMIKIVAAILWCSMCAILVPVSTRGHDFLGNGAVSDGVQITMECVADDNGTINVRLVSANGESFCGLYAVVCYESEAVRFKLSHPSEALMGADGVLSCVDREGELFVMIDNCANFSESELGELVFGLAEDSDERDIGFELKLLSLYVWEKDALVKSPICKSFFSVMRIGKVHGGEIRLSAIKMLETADEMVISMLGTAPQGCFAAGFEVYVVELSGFSSRKMSLVGVLGVNRGDGADFSRVLELPMSGKYCVIIKPSAYYRNRVECGDELVILIENGSILY